MRRTLLASACAALALSGQALAFDCAKASTVVEKAICADPALKAADDAMAEAYEAAKAKLDAKQQDALKSNQQAWIKNREDSCGYEGAPVAECAKEKIAQRTNYLLGKPLSGPGLAALLIPYIVSQPQTEKTCSAEAAMHLFVAPASTPGEKGFNEKVEALVKSTGEENGTREVTPDYTYDCSWSLDSSITYASPDVVAAVIDMYAYGGGAHGMYGRIPLVVDFKTGTSPAFGDIFPESAKADLVTACTASIREEKVKRFSDVGDAEATKELLQGLDEDMKNYAEAIAAGVADLGRWIVYEDRAEVYFPPYELGSYAEGDYVCKLDTASLQKASGGNWLVP